jgi:hypothetical protein
MKKLLCVVLFAAACGSSQKDADTLTESIRAYNEGMRWQRFEVAAGQLPPKDRGTWVDEMDERADDLKITDYEIIKVDGRGSKVAKVQVKVSWYKDSEGTLRETHAVQTWEQHGKLWWMVDETRVRGAEMPGLTEPVDKPQDKPPGGADGAAGTGTKASLAEPARDRALASDAPRPN